MKRRWIVTALGEDRPGIVAGVTELLYRLGCNLEDSAMTRLEGAFAIMLVFSSPAGLLEERLQRALAALEKSRRLAIHLRLMKRRETQTPLARGRAYLICVYGADRAGIVFRVSQALARGKVNITDVHTHRSASSGRNGRSRSSLYLMILEVEAPRNLRPKRLERQLIQLGKRLGVEVSIRSIEEHVL